MAKATGEKVAFWGLELTDIEQTVVPHPVKPCIRGSGVPDIGFFPEPDDVRVPVDKADIQRDGKYHSIVKLFIRYQATDTWTTATGWLSRDDLVVTAAHCVLDGDKHATYVRVHIGYSASDEAASYSPDNQRPVTSIALPCAWSDAEVEQFDIAFLQLDRPFLGVTPIKYDTPETETQQQLTFVGYPADMGARAGSPGGEMYYVKMRQEMEHDPTSGNMLVYRGDTWGGFSGSPIIRDIDFVAIGVHIRGGSFNFGAIIGGPSGVNFDIYEKALRVFAQGSQTDVSLGVEADPNKEWLNYIYIP